MATEQLRTLVETRCVCGGRVVCVETTDALRTPGVIHEVPMCSDFDNREPDDFLAWLRGEYEKGVN